MRNLVLVFSLLASTLYAGDNRRLLNLSIAFSPANLSNLLTWADCSNTANITVDGSNNISALTERSTNAFSYAQATAAKQPLLVAGVKNSLSVCRFPGNSTNGYLAANIGSNLSAYTFCLLHSSSSQAQFNTLYSTGSGSPASNQMTLEIGSGADKLDVWYSGISPAKGATGTGSYSTSTWYWSCVTSNNATPLFTIWKNNVSASTSAQASGILQGNTVSVGKDGGANFNEYRGDIAEWVITSSVMSTTEMTNLYNYEVAKWNLP